MKHYLKNLLSAIFTTHTCKPYQVSVSTYVDAVLRTAVFAEVTHCSCGKLTITSRTKTDTAFGQADLISIETCSPGQTINIRQFNLNHHNKIDQYIKSLKKR